MNIGPHVFGNERFGVWYMGNGDLNDRAGKLARFCGGAITDLFLPEPATKAHKAIVRSHGLFVATWTTPHNRGPFRYAQESLAAMDRQGSNVLELNIEVRDVTTSEGRGIEDFTRDTVGEIRKTRPNLRVRINIAPFKARFLPIDLFVSDPNLFVIEQAYFGNMDGRASEADVLLDMLEAGIPLEKCSVMYGAANYDPFNPATGMPRTRSLPAMPIRRLRRGSIYQDDLMADAGLL